MQAPSASNTAGTALGTLAAGFTLNILLGALWVPPIAAALALTPAGLAGLASVLVGAGVNYGVTHWAEVANLNTLIATWWPKIQHTYPGDPSGPVSVAGPNININQIHTPAPPP